MSSDRIKNPDVVIPVTGTVFQEVPDVTSSSFLSAYNVSVDSGDFVTSSISSNGQQYTEVSIDPLSANETITSVELKKPISFPAYAEIEASISQRTKGDYFVVELTDKDTSIVDLPTEYTFTAVSQTTTTLTVTLNSAFDGYLGSWVDIYGLVDTRFNYTNLSVATISIDKKTLTFTTSNETTLPSVSATPASLVGGKLKRQAKLMAATNAVAMRFSGAAATSAAYMTRFGGASIKEYGTLATSRLVTNASTVTQYISGANGQVEIKASSKFRIDVEPEQVTFTDKGVDTTSTFSTRVAATAVKPNMSNKYYIRIRGVNPISTTRPIAKIVSAVKTGTTTATITTNVPHGLTTTSYVTILGIRDQAAASFPNLTTPTAVASIVDATKFTIVIGTASTVTSYGGSVVLCNGGVTQQGLLGQVVQSAARDSLGFVTLVGNASWSGFGGIGEYVNIYGLRSAADGSDLLLDGVYRINNAVTTTLILEPVFAVNGLGNPVTPSGGVITTTNCGGIIILRTTFRSYDILLSTYSQTVTKIIGQGTNRLDLAIPTYSVGGSYSSIQGSAAAISGTTGLGGWYIHQAIVGLPDIASAALTSTTTTSAIANNLGNGFQVNVVVTAVTGTAPTLDVRIEESFDGGTNWVTLYEMQRITANGSYNTPIMRATGRHIRYVQTVGGTSPSFTRAVTRNVLPFIPAEPQKRLMDRSISLTTANSVTPVLFSGAANNVQLVINLGTATTPPAIQIEGSEDGVNFYTIGTPLTGVASSTVQTTVSGLSVTFIRARVSTVGATVVAGYVSLKAWS